MSLTPNSLPNTYFVLKNDLSLSEIFIFLIYKVQKIIFYYRLVAINNKIYMIGLYKL